MIEKGFDCIQQGFIVGWWLKKVSIDDDSNLKGAMQYVFGKKLTKNTINN